MQVLLFSFFLLSLAGCAIKQSPKRDFIKEYHQEVIAKFADLPDVPFQAQLKFVAVNVENHDELELVYETSMTASDVMVFYEQQMERLGWQLFAQSTTHDCILHYTKPVHFCSILIQDAKFTLYFCKKKGA